MKNINLLLSIVTLTFLSACDSGGDGGSSGSSTPGSTPSNVSAIPETQVGVSTSELSAPEGFSFSTEREVSFNLSVASSQSDRGFMSIYTEFNEGIVDHTSQIILTPMNDTTEFTTNVMLPNHVDKIWVEVWYPSALGNEIKTSVDIVDNTVNAIL
ncbi:hypothetical protein [Aliivibrio sp. SR45-2]|uniref:hypothetical protein n=1 Tax=Aliivibrio sp. SR45-2 TaxID=2760931 RepID=UPI0015FCC2A3|nr:hypothetical protein [Aliivibrio sp. SR45-2]MBB1313041.1 hypothetical protein [Aliivibrio sp. SR45-2]